MATTHFNGPVNSANGFIGAVTGNIVGNVTGNLTGNVTGSSAVITNIDAGASGTAGSLDVFPSTASKGKIALVAADSAGDTTTTITNASQAGAVTYTIPDAGASANFVMSEGTATINGAKTFGSAMVASSTLAVTGALTCSTDKTDFAKFVSLNDILIASVGTWTMTRIAQGNYVLRHTAADDTSVIGIDITPFLRSTASKGFKLNSIDVIYSIDTAALDAHTATLDQIAYANNVAVAVTSVPLTGTPLQINTQANPYVTNMPVTTPAFDVTLDSKYVFELTVDAAATSAYDLYGIVLKFARNDL